MGIGRSTYRYRGRGKEQSGELKHRIVSLAGKHKRYGYRRITAVLRREDEWVNHKRVWRVWKEEGLSLPRRKPAKRRTHKQELPNVVEYRGHV